MKFEIMRDKLLDGLNDVMKAISQKVAIPILTGIKIEVDEKGMTMTGSDSDITIVHLFLLKIMGNKLLKSLKKEVSYYKQKFLVKLFVNYQRMK